MFPSDTGVVETFVFKSGVGVELSTGPSADFGIGEILLSPAGVGAVVVLVVLAVVLERVVREGVLRVGSGLEDELVDEPPWAPVSISF